jgi:hypothetical protein
MPRTIGVFISSLAVLGFISMAAAAPFATNIAVDVAAQDLLIQVDFKCRKVDGQIVCGSTKSNKNRDDDDDDDDDDKPKKSKDKVIPKTCGKKVNCEVGYVKLSKPNAHGACCEAAPAKQQEAAKCKFPGQIDPPKCDCPPGTEFMGYKGCVKEKPSWWCFSGTNPGTTYGMPIKASSLGEAQQAFAREVGALNKQVVGTIHCKPDP